jgi:uncharacterized protein (UPF0333 family)
MELKCKYSLGQLIKFTGKDLPGEPNKIGEITEIIFNHFGITYNVEGYRVTEDEIIASFSQDVVAVKKTRNRKKKTAIITQDVYEGKSFADI